MDDSLKHDEAGNFDGDDSLKHDEAGNFDGDYNVDGNNFSRNDIDCEENNLSGNDDYR